MQRKDDADDSGEVKELWRVQGVERQRLLRKAKALVLRGATLGEAAKAIGLKPRSLGRISTQERWIEARADQAELGLASIGFDWSAKRDQYRARAYLLAFRWFESLEAAPLEDVHRSVATFSTLNKAICQLVGITDGSGGTVTTLVPAIQVVVDQRDAKSASA